MNSKDPRSELEEKISEIIWDNLEAVDTNYGIPTINGQEITTIIIMQAVDSYVAEQGLKELCWIQKPGKYLACDRVKDHAGLHTWEQLKAERKDGV